MLQQFVWASFTKLALREANFHSYLEFFSTLLKQNWNITPTNIPLNRGQSDSLKAAVNVDTSHDQSWFPSSFLSSLYLSCVLVCCLSHVRSLLIGQRGRVKHRDAALMSLVLHYSLPLCSFVSFFLFTRPLLTTNFSANSRSSVVVAVHVFFVFFFLSFRRLLSELKLHYIFRKAPWRVILEPCMLRWCRLSQASAFSTVAGHLEPQAADRSLLADKSAAQHH